MQNTLFFGIIAVVTLATATILTTSAYAINDKWATDCTGPGNSDKAGDCPGGSEGSGPHDETLTNPSGKNQPPGQQEAAD